MASGGVGSGGVGSGGVGDGEVQQAADTTSAADCPRQVLAPMVLDDIGCAVGVRDDFLDQHPAVIEISVRRGRSDLLHASVDVAAAVGARPPTKPDSMVNLCHFPARMISHLPLLIK